MFALDKMGQQIKADWTIAFTGNCFMDCRKSCCKDKMAFQAIVLSVSSNIDHFCALVLQLAVDFPLLNKD